MCPQPQDGHHEMPNLYPRPRKPSAFSRPFPPGFTPVIQAFPSTHRSIKASNSSPIFLSPTLRSPLPPSNGGFTMEKHQARSNRLPKTPLRPLPSQSTPSKLIPSIKQICSATRPSQRESSHFTTGVRPAFPARDRSDHSVFHSGPATSNPIATRLRSLSQHSYILSKPKLCELKPPSPSESSTEKKGDSSRDKTVSSQVRPKAKSGLPRIRSISTSLSTHPVEVGACPFLECRHKKPGNDSKKRDVWLELPCARRSTKEPPVPRINHVEHAPTPYLRSNSGSSEEIKSVKEVDLKKLPDHILNNWTSWRMEIISSSCHTFSSDNPAFSKEVS